MSLPSRAGVRVDWMMEVRLPLQDVVPRIIDLGGPARIHDDRGEALFDDRRADDRRARRELRAGKDRGLRKAVAEIRLTVPTASERAGPGTDLSITIVGVFLERREWRLERLWAEFAALRLDVITAARHRG